MTDDPIDLARRSLFVAAAALGPMAAWPAAGPPLADTTSELRGLCVGDAGLRTVYDAGRWCEGPAWSTRACGLVFSDVKADRLLLLGDGGRVETLREPAHHTNGNAFDAQGRLVSCEHLGRRLVRQEADGSLRVLADRYRGGRLNSPNDLALHSDGAVWFTDPTFGIEDPTQGRPAVSEQPARHVFRLDPCTGLEAVSTSFEQPNGIAFSPDEKTLYVSDTRREANSEGRHEIRAFDVIGRRRLADERVFAVVRPGVADGLAVDERGNVWAACADGAHVHGPDGRRLGRVATPSRCANLAFGGPTGRTLFLCCGTQIVALETTVRAARALG